MTIDGKHFVDNPHRGLAIGMLDEGSLIQLSWIMGRSDNSQNRIYVARDDVVRTEAFDASKMQDPSLIIYNAMRSPSRLVHVVSNGDQTDTIADAQPGMHGNETGSSFYSALQSRHCEPDAPILTARISGIVESGADQAYFSVLKADPSAREHWRNSSAGVDRDVFRYQKDFLDAVDKLAGLNRHEFPTQRQTFEMPLRPGYGFCIQTYNSGSRELPPFSGEPFEIPFVGSASEVAGSLWGTLEPAWRVSLAAKVLPRQGGYEAPLLLNKHHSD